MQSFLPDRTVEFSVFEHLYSKELFSLMFFLFQAKVVQTSLDSTQQRLENHSSLLELVESQ